MATTIASGFQKFRENLEITSLQGSETSSRQQNVREWVAKEMTVVHSFLTGSYTRNTMIAPLTDADIDVMLVMHHSYYATDGQVSLLDKVKRALAKPYSGSNISRDGQAVTIRFSDFWVDVVPAFNRQGGGYLIPDSARRRWIETDPEKHTQLWSQMNSVRDEKFVPLIKMLKSWNRAHGRLLNSFHLETLAYHAFYSTGITDFPTAARHFFQAAQYVVTNGSSDPAGYGGNVGIYLDVTKKSEVISRLQAAHYKADLAITYAGHGQIEMAIDKWRMIFGDYFPAYG